MVRNTVDKILSVWYNVAKAMYLRAFCADLTPEIMCRDGHSPDRRPIITQQAFPAGLPRPVKVFLL